MPRKTTEPRRPNLPPELAQAIEDRHGNRPGYAAILADTAEVLRLAIDYFARRPRLIDVAAVTDRTGLSRTTLHKLTSEGLFPAPRKIEGVTSSRWIESEVDAWIERQVVNAALAKAGGSFEAAA